jgi:hypothetical protein
VGCVVLIVSSDSEVSFDLKWMLLTVGEDKD